MHWAQRLGPFAVLASVSALAAPEMTATPAPASEPEANKAMYVAALDLSTRELAEQVKGGRDDLRPFLPTRLKTGAAFIGAAYLAGDQDEGRSHALLNTAREAQKAISESELAARQASCDGEGARLLVGASALERAVMSRIAAKRMKRLLSE